MNKCVGETAWANPEKRPNSVGAIIHSAQIDPIHPDRTHGDKSDESGAINDGPYNEGYYDIFGK